ncbi:CDP-alcohol phosphatidyltransferase, partial [Streptomyces sp. NPDC096080]
MPVFTRLRQQPDPGATAAAAGPSSGTAPRPAAGRGPRARLERWRQERPGAARWLRWTVTALAAALVLTALLLPDRAGAIRPDRFTRLPMEAILGAALVMVLPRRPRQVVAAVAGAALGAMTALNLLDMGFGEYLGRPFNLVLDWGLLPDAQAYVRDAMGRAAAVGATVGVVVLILLLLTVTALATVRLAHLLA